MQGVVVFYSVQAAMYAGFEVLQPPTEFGYECRQRTARGWAKAIIVLTPAMRRTAC